MSSSFTNVRLLLAYTCGILALAVSAAGAAAPLVRNPETNRYSVSWWQRNILGFSDSDIKSSYLPAKKKGRYPSRALGKLYVKYLLNPAASKKPTPLEQELIDYARKTGVPLKNFDPEKYHDQFSDLKNAERLAFVKRRFRTAVELNKRAESSLMKQIENYRVLYNPPQGREDLNLIRYRSRLRELLIYRLYYRLIINDAAGRRKQVSTKEIIKRVPWDKVMSPSKTGALILTLLIMNNDAEGFEKFIVEDMKDGRSRARLFMSREITKMRFTRLRAHKYWLSRKFTQTIDRLEKQVLKQVPSCRYAHSHDFKCIPWDSGF